MILNSAPVARTRYLTLSTTPQVVAGKKTDRRILMIQASAAVIVGFGPTAPSNGMQLAVAAIFNPVIPPGDQVWVWAVTGTPTCTVIEG